MTSLSSAALSTVGVTGTPPTVTAVFPNTKPLPAIATSFRAATANLGAVTLFVGTFVVISVAARTLFHVLSFPLDYLVFTAIGLVALPLFVAGLYASYQELFPGAAR
mgnify:CR=1 FL=1